MPGGDAVSPALGVLGRNQQRRRSGHLLSASAKLAPVGSWWRCSVHVTFAKHRPPLRVSQSRSGHCGEQSTNNPSGSSAVGLSSLFVVRLKCHDLSAQEAAMADLKRGWSGGCPFFHSSLPVCWARRSLWREREKPQRYFRSLQDWEGCVIRAVPKELGKR